MSKQYTSSVILREPRPRSRRLLGLGRNASAAAASSVLKDSALSDLFELVVISSGGENEYVIRAKHALYSDYEISAGGVGPTGAQTEGVSHLRSLLDVYHNDNYVLRSDGMTVAQDGDVLAFDATNLRWYAKSSGNGGVSAYSDLSGKPSINNVTLASGNNTLSDLGIAAADHSHSGYVTTEALSLANVASADVAAAVEDYTNSGYSIKIGYYGASLSTADYFAMYAVINNQVVIKDMTIDSVKSLLEIPSGTGVSAYSDLSGKPSINGHELASGNNTLSTLEIAAAGHDHEGVYAAKRHDHSGVYASFNHTHDNYLTLSGLESLDITVKSLTIPSTSISGFLKIGQAYLWYDQASGALCVSGASGAAMDLYATGEVGAGGPGDSGGDTGGVSHLRSLLDVYHNSNYVLRSDGLTVAQDGDVLAVDATNLRWYAKSGSNGGVSAYSDLSGKPSINNVTLTSGNNTLSDLGIAAASHTHSGYAASNHNHNGVYSAVDHNHDSAYAASNHDHDESYAAISHTHDGYAASNHNHDGIYSVVGHNHDSAYAAANHDHNGVYAAVGHTHSGYAASDHDHDGRYALLNHTHNNYLTLSGLESLDITVKSLTIPSTSISGFLKIGQAYLWYDQASGALCVSGASGAAMDFCVTGEVSAGNTSS